MILRPVTSEKAVKMIELDNTLLFETDRKQRKEEIKVAAEAKKAEMLENAKKEVDNMILGGKKILESEKAKIIEEAKKEIVSLVVLATEKLLESNPDEKSESKAINHIKNI
jgi:F0F1-type ATP synthase membrane subunit b/b'